MAERSLLWQSGVGDGGPYTDEELRVLVDILGLSIDANVGVVRDQLNALIVTSTGGNDIRVATGRAICDGTAYENDALLIFSPASPVVGTTGRRVVLQKDWTARTIRAAILDGVDGTITIPALTQTDGVTWEIPLASFTITTGGVIGALTDQREFTEANAVTEKQYVSRIGSNRYSAPGWECDSFAGQAISSLTDRMIFQLIVVPQTMTVDRIAVETTAGAGAGETARLGIYTAVRGSGGFVPKDGSLLLDAGSALAIDGGAGLKEDTISITLTPGYYFLAMATDATAGSMKGPLATSYVSTPVIGAGTTPFAAQNHILLSGADAGANWSNNGLPDTAPTVTGYLGVEFAMIQLRDLS